MATGMALCCAGIAATQETSEIELLRQENAQLRARVERLEGQLQEVIHMVKQMEPANAVMLTAEEAEHLRQAAHVYKETVEKNRKWTWSSADVRLYGYIKGDVSYDTSRINTGNFARWVETEDTLIDDDDLNITARETRLGLEFKGPVGGSTVTSGKLEVDFYGSGAENKPEPMMRHAYLQVDWPDYEIWVLAGQTSDVFSPLVPTTLNYSVAWWAGNIGYRRPQIRLGKLFHLGDSAELKLEAAAARSIGRQSGFDPGDSGEDWRFPVWETRVGLSFPFVNGQRATLGLSGHYGKEQYDTNDKGDSQSFHSWSANVDLTLPLTPWLKLTGEYFHGTNLDTYLGGIGQGVNMVTLEEIDPTGGWMAIGLGPFGKWTFNLGGSLEHVDVDDVEPEQRTQNRSLWANVFYSINEKTSVGFEFSSWNTQYKDLKAGDSFRFQTSLIYRF